MIFHKVTLSSKDKLTLIEKKNYINSMYEEEEKWKSDQKRNQGFLMKFNNSIGFKPVVSTIFPHNAVIPQAVEIPDDYLSPQDILLEYIHTPLDSHDVICFYLEDKKVVHPNPKFSYETKIIAKKMVRFFTESFSAINGFERGCGRSAKSFSKRVRFAILLQVS